MILFFGIGDRTHTDHGPLSESDCPFCGKRTFRILSKVRYWITLFFIPTIPYKTEWTSRCKHCSGEIVIDPNDLDCYKREADLLQKALDEDWDDDTYQNEKTKAGI